MPKSLITELRNLRKLLAALTLLLLTSCGGTASNMSHEISSWFNPTPASNVQAMPVPPAPSQVPGQPMPPPPPGFAPTPNTPILAPAYPQAPAVMHETKVALLLPLSGSEAALGKNLQQGAELAVLDLGREHFELMPRDSGSDPKQAAAAAQDAIRGGAQLIVGPLFSLSVEAVKPIARAAGVPVLALSNDWKVAGGGAYVLGFSPVEQVQRIAEYAASRGLQNIAILAPASLYGDLVVATLKQGSSGVNVVAVARYQNNAASVAAAVQELSTQRQQFQALVLPEGGAMLHQVASQLSAHSMTARQLPLLGTGLWDEENTSSDFALIGGWYAAPDSSARPGFIERYKKNFGAKPARLASLAYDAIALAEALAAHGGEHPFDDAAITNPNGFAGVDGIFRLNARGTTERGLAILEVTKQGPRVVDPAPKRF